MEPKIIQKGKTKVAGYSIRTTEKDGKNFRDIPEFWGRYMSTGMGKKLHGESFVKCHDEYGICIMLNKDGDIEYLIGLESKEGEIPAEYKCFELPPAQYAVFTTPPSANESFSGEIQKLWGRVFSEWMPRSGFAVNETAYSYELYPESGMVDNKMVCEIFIPVSKG
jgi:AraC family transcriptional regulator